MNLSGRRVLVTGASRGIGEALAHRFAEAGAHVVLVARNATALEKLAEELGGTALPADLTDPGAPERVVADAGEVDVLVNNAGLDAVGAFAAMDLDDIESIYRLNLVAPVLLTRHVLPGMLERGRGRLVNISSLAGVAAYPGMATYASTKAGLSQFTEVVALDLKGLPVGTTLVELGPIPTDMLDSVESYAPTGDSFNRARQLRLITDIPREQVADEVVRAVQADRSHVRLPKRAIPFSLMTQLPREIVRATLTGVKHRA